MDYKYLPHIASPEDIKKFSAQQLNELAAEIRKRVIELGIAPSPNASSLVRTTSMPIKCPCCLGPSVNLSSSGRCTTICGPSLALSPSVLTNWSCRPGAVGACRRTVTQRSNWDAAHKKRWGNVCKCF